MVDTGKVFDKNIELPRTHLDFKSIEFSEEDGGTQVILASMEIGENEYYAVVRGVHEDSKVRFLKLKAIAGEDGDEEKFDVTEYTSVEKIAQIARRFMGESESEPQEDS